MQVRKGGCLCGAVRYVIRGNAGTVGICHCAHCQKAGGGLFSCNLFVDEVDYEQQGETIIYEDKGESGQPLYRHFCRNCGSPVMTKVVMLPGQVLVKVGTLDNKEDVRPPQTEIYTDRAVEWLAPFPGAIRFAQSP
jgi:hypothetical protein